MGEWSRRIGEVGEQVVGEFLDLIGWTNPLRAIELPCMKGQQHSNGTNPRSTHGIDFLFSYESQLVDRTVDNLVISVKYTSNPYPSNPSRIFKEHFKDLTRTMECFHRSELRRSSNSHFSGIDSSRAIGVLFWLSNQNLSENDNDVIQKVANVRDIGECKYDSIYLVDNKRVSFIYDAIKYLSLKNPHSQIEFFYPDTGKNYNQVTREYSGKILPVEFINSPVLSLKIKNQDQTKTVVVAVSENFNRDHLKRLIGLAAGFTSGWARDTLILFPDFDPLHHENMVSEAKSGFRDRDFTQNVRVSSFRRDFRNVDYE